MADNFGAIQAGRAFIGGRFYATPSVSVGANVIFMPAYSTSPLFGVAEYPVEAGKLGAFATDGTFVFDAPEGWTSSAGQSVYWAPTSATEGSFSTTGSTGSVLLGFEVTANVPAGKIGVFLARPTALES